MNKYLSNISLFAFGMMGYPYDGRSGGYGMMAGRGGEAWGLLVLLIAIVWTTVGILAIVWLWQNIHKK